MANEGNVLQRLNKVMADVKGVEKSSVNQHDRYNYAGHQAVNDAIRDAFVKHGVVQTVSITRTQVLEGCNVQIDAVVTWSSSDDPSSKVEMGTSAIQPPRSPKQPSLTAQQVGQAISYAVKCVQFKGLMLRGDNEPDSDGGAQGDERGDAYEPPVDQESKTRAAEELAKFGTCQTADDVIAQNKAMRKLYDQGLISIPGIVDQILKAREKAMARVKAGG